MADPTTHDQQPSTGSLTSQTSTTAIDATTSTSTTHSQPTAETYTQTTTTESVNHGGNQAPPPPTYHPSKSSSNKKKSIIITLILLGLIGYVVWNLYHDKQAIKHETVTLEGRIDVQQTPIASKVAGRVAKIYVKEGDNVAVGMKIIDMESPEINAKIDEANAAKQMAQSQLDKTNNGARPQEIDAAKYQYDAAQSAADLARVTYERINRLASEGLMSKQKRDEAYTNYVASKDKAEMAKAQYSLAKTGARDEDKSAATAQVAEAEGKLKEALIAKDEANLKSPISGIVDDVIAKSGSVVGQGVPLITMIDPNDQWVVMNVTEKNLGKFAVGSQFTGTVPALSTQGHPYQQTFQVYASSALSDFATWRPTNSKDGFDMRTFEIKARPVQPDSKLRQGMSVLVTLDQPVTTK